MNTSVLDIVWDPEDEHPGDRLQANYWDLRALESPDEPTAFQLPYGEWIRLFRAS